MRIVRRKKAPKTIAILRALQLGDLLCSVPAIRALRTAFPEAHISLIGLPWARQFVTRFSSYLDEFIEFPGWPGLPERQPKLDCIPSFLEEMQSRGFDLVLQMHGAGTITNPLVALFSARQTAGFYLPGQFAPTGGEYFIYPEGEPEIRIFLRMMEQLGIPLQGENLEFPITADEQAEFESLMARYALAPGRYICLHPGARDPARRWPTEKFAAVGDQLADLGLQVLVTGTADECELTGAVVSQMQAPALDLSGQTGLGSLTLLLSKARLLVCNDTGVSHLAAVTQTPSVILVSNSVPGRWRPLDHQRHRVIPDSGQAAARDVLAEAEDFLKEVEVDAKAPF